MSNKTKPQQAYRQVKSGQPVGKISEDAEPERKQQPRFNKNKNRSGISASVGNPKDTPQGTFDPKALDHNKTAEKNDPLMKDSILVEGVTSGVPVEKDRHFELDYSQFEQLIASSYRVMTSQDRGLRKFVSLSMYTYYCTTLLWKRIYFVLTDRGQGVNEYDAFKRSLPPMAIPTEIGLYLDGIGHIRDANNRKFYLRLQAELRAQMVNGIPGHYGRVDSVTHILYETLPAPFIAVLRIVKDALYTSDPNMLERAWDLPVELRPGVANVVPNRNLLGWDICEKLTPEQMTTIQQGIILSPGNAANDPWTFNIPGLRSVHAYPILYEILLNVGEVLKGAKNNQASFNDYAENSSYSGSQAQSGYNVRSQGQHGISGHQLRPTYLAEATAFTYYQASMHVLSAVSLMRYRQRRSVTGSNDMLCYTGPNGGSIPGWHDNEDDVYNSVPEWNLNEFRAIVISGQQVSDKFSERVRKIEPREAASN